jgi:hypothetical protein
MLYNKKLRYRLIPIIGILILSLFASGAMAAGMEETGHMSNGPSFDLVEHNGYLYTGEGSEIRVYDVSTPDKVAQLNWVSGVPHSSIGQLDTKYFVNDLSSVDHYLYITTEGRFIIADISTPATPVILSSIENTFDTFRYPMYATEIRGNYAYLSLQGKGIMVIDITNRASPTVIRTVTLAGNNVPKRLTSSGQYLYVGLDGDKRMDILDLASPSNPVIVGSYAPTIDLTTSTFSGVAVKDNVAYIAEYHWGVRAVDVSNPRNPVEIGLLRGVQEGDINANDIKILGNYAYVSTRYQGVMIVDISNPRSLKTAGIGNDERTSGYTEGIYVNPKYTFLAVSTFGIGIYDTSDVTKPRFVANIPVNSGVDSVKAKDNYVYLGAHNLGVWIMDVTDPAHPNQVGFANTKGRILGIDAQGNYVYTAGAWMGLTVIDVSQPANPKIVVQNYGSSISQVLVDGNYAYTSVGIVDISNPLKPAYVANPANFDDSSDFARLGSNYLIVVNDIAKKGLFIYDITNKANPVLVTSYGTGVAYTRVAVDGNIATVLSGNDVITLDVTDPRNPVELGKISYAGSWSGRGITLDKDNPHMVYAFGGINDDIRTFDISDPRNIRFIESINLPGTQECIDYNKGFIYTGGLYSGAYVLSTSILPKINHPPVISGISNKTIVAGKLLEFTVVAQDPDGDPLSYSAQNLPANAAFNTVTHVFSWIPGTTQIGNVYVPVFMVSDSKLTATKTIYITVTSNHPPTIALITPVTVTEGSTVNFTVTATDPDGDLLNYSAQNLPSGATFSPSSQVFSWTPGVGQAGSYSTKFTVSDGLLINSTNASITVTAANRTNHPPVITEIGNKTIVAGKLLKFTVVAQDPDGDPLSYSARNLPANATFDNLTHIFSWIPGTNQNGFVYAPVFTVTDSKLSVNKTVYITVTSNHPPTIAPITPVTVTEGSTVNFTVTATDQDGDLLNYAAENLPSGATFSTSSQVFSWTPRAGQAGSYSTRFTVSDGLLTNSTNASIKVTAAANPVNHPPVIADIAPVTVTANTPVRFTVTASDPDSDPLTYEMTMTPPGAVFNPSSRVFTWTPQQTGNFAAQFVVSDGKTQVAKSTYITVIAANPTNHPPVITDIPPVTVVAGTPVRFTVTASDANGDLLTYTMTMAPPGAAFNPTSRVFTWTPQQAGSFTVQFLVSDGKTQVAKSTYITVTPANPTNHPPVIADIAPVTVTANTPVRFTVAASDTDGDPLTYEMTMTPPGAVFNPSSRVFTWTPQQTGSFAAQFVVSDGKTQVAKSTYIIIKPAYYIQLS